MRQYSSLLVVGAGFLLMCLLTSQLQGSVTVLSKSSSSVRLRFEAEWTEHRDHDNGTAYSQWSANGIDGIVSYGGMKFPSEGFTILLPGETTPHVRIAHRTSIQRSSHPLPPAPVRANSDTGQHQLIHFNGISNFRGYLLGEFQVLPVTYDQGRVTLVTEAEFVIRWDPPAGKVSEGTRSALERSILQQGVIVPDKLVKPERHSLRKSTAVSAIDRSGTWYTISVNETGMYRLSYDYLQSQEIPVAGEDINLIRMFAPPNFGLPLETARGATLEEIGPALQEIPIQVIDSDDDGVFNSGDAIEFYGQASSRYTVKNNRSVEYIQNPYETVNVYWLNLPDGTSEAEGLRLEQRSITEGGPVHETTRGLYHFEEDLNNFFNSGLEWFGRTFFGTRDEHSYTLELPGILPDSSADIEVRVARGNSNTRNDFSIYLNGTSLGRTTIASGESAIAVRTVSEHLPGGNTVLDATENILRIRSQSTDPAAEGHLDYIDVRYLQSLTYPENSSQYRFFTRSRTGLHTYRVSDVSADEVTVMNVTNPSEAHIIPTTSAQNGILFPVDFGADPSVKEIVVVRNDAGQRPESIEAVSSFEQPILRRNDLRVDYLVITAEEFIEEARRLAEFRSSYNDPRGASLNARTVTVQSIYNEFSGGVQDPRALRNFITYVYHQWQGEAPLQYVVLFGDGDYDYRNISGQSGMFVPTWQNRGDSEYNTKSIDDEFVRVIGRDRTPDIALGRLTCASVEEAQHMVDKIIQYETDLPFGQWRSTVTLVGDDPFRPEEDPETWGEAHIEEMERQTVPQIPEVFHLRKIYLPEYPKKEDLSSFGYTRPAVTDALLEQLRTGTLIVNFSGHGSPSVWTQERVLSQERDLARIETGRKLPLWVAATCNWGQFDMIESRSMTEEILALENNGAIGVISSTRLSFLGPNQSLMSAIFRSIFSDPLHRANSMPLGTALIMAKLTGGGASNNERYALFGDPALRLASPKYSARIEQVRPDTLSALSQVDFEGEVQLDSAENVGGFSGTGYVSMFDSDVQVAQEYERFTLNYTLPGSRIFYGPVSISNGAFTGELIVPKDINYGGDQGKITVMYRGTDSLVTGAGYRSPLVFRGTAPGVRDDQGPDIQIGFEDYQFTSGDVISADALLDVRLHDEYGINLTGSIGHQLKLLVSGDENAEYNLTEFFSYEKDSYKTGHIRYPLPDLEPGEYTFTVRAWDSSNNLSVRSADVTLIEGGQFQVARAYNYPNPVKNETDFTFALNQAARVTISIYTLSGQPVQHLESHFALPGFQSIHWNGRDAYGALVGNGVYLYKIKATATTGDDTDTYIGKLAITR